MQVNPTTAHPCAPTTLTRQELVDRVLAQFDAASPSIQCLILAFLEAVVAKDSTALHELKNQFPRNKKVQAAIQQMIDYLEEVQA